MFHIFDFIAEFLSKVKEKIVYVYSWISGVIRCMRGLPRYPDLPVWVGKEKAYMKIYEHD